MKINEMVEKVDKKALSGAVGLMLMSWGALPIVYWLILRKKGDKNNDK